MRQQIRFLKLIFRFHIFFYNPNAGLDKLRTLTEKLLSFSSKRDP